MGLHLVRAGFQQHVARLLSFPRAIPALALAPPSFVLGPLSLSLLAALTSVSSFAAAP